MNTAIGEDINEVEKCRSGAHSRDRWLCPGYSATFAIACDKREAFAQGSDSDEAIHLSRLEAWIASLRSQ